jgi:catechol 2,3-dioxygenase
VTFTITDLDRSIAFYQDDLGLRVHERGDADAVLGDGELDLLALIEEPEARPAGRHAGLYHVALLFGEREELARAAQRLAVRRTTVHGASDHGVSEAIYLADPDGNGLELYADRPRTDWPRGPRGELEMYTLPLDVEALLGLVADDEPVPHAHGLRVGHVHLHVGDLHRALQFYRDVLGFEPTATMPSAAFLSAGGYHHHVGLNTWRGEGVAPMPGPTEVVGLRRWTIRLDEPDDVAGVRARINGAGVDHAERDDGMLVLDPWDIPLLIAAEV